MLRWLWSLSVAVLFLVMGCGSGGPSTEACGPSNCGGCCTTDDVCHPGNELDLCGGSGSACDVCVTGQFCSKQFKCEATGGGAGGGSAAGGGGGSSFAASAKGLVRFKKNERLTADYAKSLGLQSNQVCNELGLYSCANVVHHLALGGVDPYNIGVYEPLPFTGLTSPIVTDRVALSACIQRVTADLATPATALIYKGITLDAMGKLDVSAAPVKTAIDTLYKQVLLREPTAAEVGHLSQLYTDIAATGKPDPGKSWMTLSCFAVLTSVESVFY